MKMYGPCHAKGARSVTGQPFVVGRQSVQKIIKIGGSRRLNKTSPKLQIMDYPGHQCRVLAGVKITMTTCVAQDIAQRREKLTCHPKDGTDLNL